MKLANLTSYRTALQACLRELGQWKRSFPFPPSLARSLQEIGSLHGATGIPFPTNEELLDDLISRVNRALRANLAALISSSWEMAQAKGFSIRDFCDLHQHIIQNGPINIQNRINMLSAIPHALEAGLRPSQIEDLYITIYHNCAEHLKFSADVIDEIFEAALPSALQAATQVSAPPYAIYTLLSNLAQSFKGDLVLPLYKIPNAIALGFKLPQIGNLFGQIAQKCTGSYPEAFATLETVMLEATTDDKKEELIYILKNIIWSIDETGSNPLKEAVELRQAGCSKKMALKYANQTFKPGSDIAGYLNFTGTLVGAIKLLRRQRIGSFENFSGHRLSLRSTVYLLTKIEENAIEEVRLALQLLHKYDIAPAFETLQELVEFQQSYPSIYKALHPDPGHKNQYSQGLQEACTLDFVYYQVNGHYRKAELLARLLLKNRNEERVQEALVAIRFIDEEHINLDKMRHVHDIIELAEAEKTGYADTLSTQFRRAGIIMHNTDNIQYIVRILQNFGCSGEQILASFVEAEEPKDILQAILAVRKEILQRNTMFKVETVYNKALSELACAQGDYATDAPSFTDAWMEEMPMAIDIHTAIIRIQAKTRKPVLILLNERTAPTYYARDFLPASFAQQFGIIQNIEDEAVLNTLGCEIDDQALLTLGKELFSHGLICPLQGFKIASSHNDIDDRTLGRYVRNMQRMMELLDGDVVFVDLSRRRVGGSTAYLHDYLENHNLANIAPHGKLLENQGHPFDGARGKYGLPAISSATSVTWHLVDPCKIELASLIYATANEPEELERLKIILAEYIGGHKPYSDDREAAFYTMPGRSFHSPAPGVAPRFLKETPAWCIPDMERGLVPIYEHLAGITARIVPAQVRENIGEISPYFDFPPYLTAQVDAILKDLGVTRDKIQKRFFGSACFGYFIKDMPYVDRVRLIGALYRTFNERKLPLQAVDSGKLLDIIHRGVHKGKSVIHLLKTTGIAEKDLVTIGDQPHGNDRELLAHGRAYNVGSPISSDIIMNTDHRGSTGVLEVFDEIESAGFQALAIDYDGTIDGNEEVIQRIRGYLEQGKEIAITTGRGESIQRVLLGKLKELGLSPAARRHLHIYLYNGALYLRQ